MRVDKQRFPSNGHRRLGVPGNQRRHMRPTQFEEFAYESVVVMLFLPDSAADPGGHESPRRRRVGNLAAEAAEAGEFLRPALADGFREVALEIDEKLEGRIGEELVAHEQHGREGSQQGERGHHAVGMAVGDEMVQPLAACAVADLIVIAEEIDEGGARQVRRGFAARVSSPFSRGWPCST
ncbi:hypothetical protein ACFSLT_26500 [Novosphingobium resinovorum]